MARQGLKAGREVSTLLASKLSIVGMISSVGLTMFPFILPSSIDPNSSLSVWDSSSSHLTLFVMLVSTVIFLPLILMYTAWVYKVSVGQGQRRRHYPAWQHALLISDCRITLTPFYRSSLMWYFTWILGLSVAVLFAVVNAVWLEVQDDNDWHDVHLQNDTAGTQNNVTRID